MEPSDIDRLREYRALGTLGGMTSAGVVFAAYFMEEIFKVTQQTRLFELNLLGGVLVFGIFASALGAGGFVGRLMGEPHHIPDPSRQRRDCDKEDELADDRRSGCYGSCFFGSNLVGVLDDVARQ